MHFSKGGVIEDAEGLSSLFVTRGADLDGVANREHRVERDDVVVVQANASVGSGVADRLGLVGPVDAVTLHIQSEPARS